MTKDEALKLALEALEQLQGGCTDSDDGTVEAITVWCPEVIDAIREALAQPEQEPVAWLEPEWGEKICPEIGYEVTITDDHPRDLCWIPLVPVTPPQRTWVGLTDEEVSEVLGSDIHDEPSGELDFIRAIEAKLKEKNT